MIEAMAQLKSLPFEDLGFARIDHHRSLRKGFPEVIWGEGKTTTQILSIMRQLKNKEQNILITRIDEKKARTIEKVFEGASIILDQGCSPSSILP